RPGAAASTISTASTRARAPTYCRSTPSRSSGSARRRGDGRPAHDRGTESGRTEHRLELQREAVLRQWGVASDQRGDSGMREESRWSWMAILAVLALAVPAWARIDVYTGDLGELSLSGFARVQADIHTGELNPNLKAIGRTDNNRLQLFRQWGLVDATWQTPLRNLKFFTRARVWHDSTAEA